MKDTRLYEQILGIEPPWYVEAVNLKPKQREIEIDVSFKGTIWACPKCHQRMHIHEHRKRRWRHLDSYQFKTIITCNVPVTVFQKRLKQCREVQL